MIRALAIVACLIPAASFAHSRILTAKAAAEPITR